MHPDLQAKIDEFRNMGLQYTFDGFAVADLITQLDAVAKINYTAFSGNRLSIWLGEIMGTPKEVMALIPAASIFGAMTSGAEDTPQGYLLWFEWMLPKDIYYQKQV